MLGMRSVVLPPITLMKMRPSLKHSLQLGPPFTSNKLRRPRRTMGRPAMSCLTRRLLK